MKKLIFALLFLSVSQVSLAGLYPVQWTPFTKIDYIIASGTGDGIHGSLGSGDYVFVKLQGPIVNPDNCSYTDYYYMQHHNSNPYHDQMYATLLAAAIAGKEVSLGISTQNCDYNFPTVYMVKIKSS